MYDTTKAERVLVLRYRSTEEVVEDAKRRGWEVSG
jgi:hypothetical protein